MTPAKSSERHLTIVSPVPTLTCPVCKAPLADERFYGPCGGCRGGLRQRATAVGEQAKLTLATNQAKKAADDAVEIARLEEQRKNAPPKPWEKKQQQWRRR